MIKGLALRILGALFVAGMFAWYLWVAVEDLAGATPTGCI